MSEAGGKTDSEKLFETYLKDRNLTNFEHHPDVEGTTKHPDYRVVVDSSEVFFEVTEFEASISMPNKIGTLALSAIYEQIRTKIERERKHFQVLKGRVCAIVLANPSDCLVFLNPMFIIGAMLGNIGWTMPYDGKTGACDASRMTSTFGSGGKMIRYKNGNPFRPQNTTISALCVLGMVNEGARRQCADANGSLNDLRIQIYENPYAVKALTEAFGTGPYDERFGVRDGSWQRVFVGNSLKTLEDDERAAGIKPNGPFDLGLRTKGE